MSIADPARRAGRHRVTAGRLLALLATATLGAGCGSDGATGPEAPELDAAGVAGGVFTPEVAAALRPYTPGLMQLVEAETARGYQGCTWDAVAEAYACAPFEAYGLTGRHAYTPLDAAGRAVGTRDRAAVAGLRIRTVVTGTFTGAGLADQAFTGRQEWTVRGLLEGPRVLDGTSTQSFHAVVPPGQFARQVSRVTQTVTGLVLPGAGERWPRAGTITVDTGDDGAGGARQRAVLTFDGTSRVQLDLSGDMSGAGPAWRCSLDLAAPAAPALLACVTR